MMVMVSLGLQLQAQTLCDYTYTTGSQYQLEVAIGQTGNALPTMAPIYAVTYGDGNMLAEDSCFSGPCTHMIYNYNPMGSPYDTITTCISYTVTDTMGYVDTMSCCFEQYWDGQFWQNVSMQQQNFSCDSLSYTVLQGLPMMVYMEVNGMSNMIDSIEWNTTACNTLTCYTPQGNNPYSFPSINMTDTVKFCYDAYVYTQNQMIVCSHCDSLIFDYTDSTYVLFSTQGNTTGISELEITRLNDNKIYDMLGRELTEIPLGKMYIRNQKKFIILR